MLDYCANTSLHLLLLKTVLASSYLNLLQKLTWIVSREQMGQLVCHVEALHLLFVDAVAGQLLQEGCDQDQELRILAIEKRDLGRQFKA